MFKFWVKNPKPKYEDIADVKFVGITDLSVEIHTLDGKTYRVTNPNFLNGLKVEEGRE